MAHNRTASFPADNTQSTPISAARDPHLGLKVLAVLTSLTLGLAAATLMVGTSNLSQIGAGISSAVAISIFIAAVLLARRDAARRLAAYREKNPDIELTHGP